MVVYYHGVLKASAFLIQEILGASILRILNFRLPDLLSLTIHYGWSNFGPFFWIQEQRKCPPRGECKCKLRKVVGELVPTREVFGRHSDHIIDLYTLYVQDGEYPEQLFVRIGRGRPLEEVGGSISPSRRGPGRNDVW